MLEFFTLDLRTFLICRGRALASWFRNRFLILLFKTFRGPLLFDLVKKSSPAYLLRTLYHICVNTCRLSRPLIWTSMPERHWSMCFAMSTSTPRRSRLLRAGVVCSKPGPAACQPPSKAATIFSLPVTPVTVNKQVIVLTIHWLKLRKECRGVRTWPCFSALKALKLQSTT